MSCPDCGISRLKPGDGGAGMMLADSRGWEGMRMEGHGLQGQNQRLRRSGESVLLGRAFSLPTDVVRFWEYLAVLAESPTSPPWVPFSDPGTVSSGLKQGRLPPLPGSPTPWLTTAWKDGPAEVWAQRVSGTGPVWRHRYPGCWWPPPP